jgi:hypothetical protein
MDLIYASGGKGEMKLTGKCTIRHYFQIFFDFAVQHMGEQLWLRVILMCRLLRLLNNRLLPRYPQFGLAEKTEGIPAS